MKILLDENIDIHFKNLFPSGKHQVYTVRDMQWNGIKNGKLLQLLKEHAFDCWIVADKNIIYQQNTSQLLCILIVLDVLRNTIKHIGPLLPLILAQLENVKENTVIVIPEK